MTKSPSGERSYIGRVSWVNPTMKFAMTHVQEIGRVTFSFDPVDQVWVEDSQPIKSAKVVLSKLVSTDGGWRALNARYLRPEDQVLSK